MRKAHDIKSQSKPKEFAMMDGTMRRAANTSSAIALSGGDSYDFKLHPNAQNQVLKDKPETYPVKRGVPNYTNLRIGRLVVVGYVGKSKNAGSKWACRCSCGLYTIRSGKSIRGHLGKKGRNKGETMCPMCAKIKYKKEYEFSTINGQEAK